MGKGDKPRPRSPYVSDVEVEIRWAKAFGTRCRYADEYQAIHPPRCNVGGKPCDVCAAKWRARQREDV